LTGLLDEPTAFASSFEEENDRPEHEIVARLVADKSRAVFGAFSGPDLVGVAGICQEQHAKLAHKAFLWGVYVASEFRRQGVGREVVSRSLDYAFRTIGVRHVNLGVNDSNLPAIALYESLGFHAFGLEKAYLMVGETLHDERHMVCINADWPAPGVHQV